MGNEKAHCPSSFPPRGQNVSIQAVTSNSSLFDALLRFLEVGTCSAFENLFDYSTFSYRLSVCSLRKHFWLFKSSEILAGPNSCL